ncbi:hypothetical protein [Parabacteroides sp.]
MKTIQFILSLLVVVALASCSAESDVLNEMEEHNQTPENELVSVTLNLNTTVINTKSAVTKPAEDKEKEITSYGIVVYGKNGILLFKESAENGATSITLKEIKKQDLTIYVAANLNKADMALFLENPASSSSFLKSTPAKDLPKYIRNEDVNITKDNCTAEINVTLEQLTSRINYPEFKIAGNWPNVTFKETLVTLYNAVTSPGTAEELPLKDVTYVYPSSTTSIGVEGEYIETINDRTTNIYGKVFTFGPYTITGDNNTSNMTANNIYQLILTVQKPDFSDADVPGALGIDWYIADMLTGDPISGNMELKP